MEYCYSTEEDQPLDYRNQSEDTKIYKSDELNTLIVRSKKEIQVARADSGKQHHENSNVENENNLMVAFGTHSTSHVFGQRRLGRPIKTSDRRNQRRREYQIENRLIKMASQSDLNKLENQQVLMVASELKAGKKRLSGLQPSHISVDYLRQVKQVHDNSRVLLQSSKSTHEKCEMRYMLTQGLTPKDIAEVTGLSQRSGRRIAAYNRNSISEHATDTVPVVKSGKNSHRSLCEFEIQIYKHWFESNTEVRSGSSTVLRQVTSSKHAFLFGLFASFPSLLRSACKSIDGEMALNQARQSINKTRFQIALLASYDCQTPEVVNNEYSVRYEYVKNRYKQFLQKKQSKTKQKKTSNYLLKLQNLLLEFFFWNLSNAIHYKKKSKKLGKI